MTDEQKKYFREYYKKNREKILCRIKVWGNKNKDSLLKRQRNWYENNHEKILSYHRNYQKSSAMVKYRKEYRAIKKLTDPNYVLSKNLSERVRQVIKNKRVEKVYKTYELLGAPVGVVRQHIEGQFKEGMSWNNYGHTTWHIDHIRPLASFDLKSPEEQKKAFHYTNLQPLWATENFRKGSKVVC